MSVQIVKIKVNTKSQNYFRYGSGIHFIKSYLPKKNLTYLKFNLIISDFYFGLRVNARQPGTVSNRLNARYLEIFTKMPLKGSFKLRGDSKINLCFQWINSQAV